MTLRTIYTSSILVGISILIVGCNGGSQSPMGTLPSGINRLPIPADRGRNHQGCPNDGGVSVRPCRIRFDANHSGPVSVTIMDGGNGRGDRDRHRIRESDDCASRNIATVAKHNDRRYTVAAGSVSGSCTARFDDHHHRDDDGGGGPNGGGTLRIVNDL